MVQKLSKLQEVWTTWKTFLEWQKGCWIDCSGLALYTVYQGTGIKLPHKASYQYDRASSKGKLVSSSQMKPGDLVFFKGKTIYHVAIYSGNGNMFETKGHNPDCSGIYILKLN